MAKSSVDPAIENSMRTITAAAIVLWMLALQMATAPACASGILDDLLDPKIPVEMDVRLGHATAQEVARDPQIRLLLGMRSRTLSGTIYGTSAGTRAC